MRAGATITKHSCVNNSLTFHPQVTESSSEVCCCSYLVYLVCHVRDCVSSARKQEDSSLECYVFFCVYFHPFFHTNEPLCFFPSLKKKINAKMFNAICIVFLGGGCGEIV